MRIALVHRDLHQITRGGIGTLYLALAEELTRRGHDIVLVTQDTPDPVTPAGVQVVTVPRTDDLVAHRNEVAAALDRIRPDVAECSTWEAELLTYLQRPHWAPVLVRGDLSAATMGADHLAAEERQLCRLADTVVAVSEFAATDLSTAYRIRRPAVIPNGVDRARFTPTGHTQPRSGWHVRLDQAGTITGRRPLPRVLQDDPAWVSYFHPSDPADALPRLVWVGKFTQMKGFDRLTRIAGALTGRARLLILLGHGQVHYPVELPSGVLVCQDLNPVDVPALYRAADYLLCTSRWEGYGLAIAEALACGTPALLPADLGVAPELVTDGVTGRLWANESEVPRILDQKPQLTGGLPERYTWSANAATTIVAYQALTALTNTHTSGVWR